jgi:hypothetical protein
LKVEFLFGVRLVRSAAHERRIVFQCEGEESYRLSGRRIN